MFDEKTTGSVKGFEQEVNPKVIKQVYTALSIDVLMINKPHLEMISLLLFNKVSSVLKLIL